MEMYVFGIMNLLCGFLAIIWARRPGAPKWCVKGGVALVFLGSLATVGKLFFQLAVSR
jgi:hypothetical protein